MYVEIPTRVVPARVEALEKFPAKALKDYAYGLGSRRTRTKAEAIDWLLASGRATLCASLGD